MDKPNEHLLRLVELGAICSLSIKYVQVGTDTAESRVTMLGMGGLQVKGLWATYAAYLNVQVGYNSVAHVRPRLLEQVTEWRKFEKQHAADLATYDRLRKKFGYA